MSKKKNSLKIIKSAREMQKVALSIKGKREIAFVPTMGALHNGHLSLVKKAKTIADIVVVSIFINPIQFSEKNDLKNYPKNLQKDLIELKKIGVDYVFIPKAEEIFGLDFQTKVIVEDLQQHLCGLKRKNHFDGVTTIVLKLFNIVKPHKALFGKKDMQQLLIIKKMVEDMNIDIKIIPHRIIREKNGLAMSSRNTLLNKKEKELSANIYKGLKIGKSMYNKKSNTKSINIKRSIRSFYKEVGIRNIEYVEIMNPKKMTYPKEPSKKDFIAVAVRIGKTRLIDNLEF
ncbi:MAG: pantoate--beta-alanine ligase [Thermodesulfobacteriota bacterium]|nr:pantoate--beta-alanine ligase [Thermodesulfobacteriota bacterium]